MAPTITSLSPAAGPTTGGNNVVITGTGFTGPASVLFGGTATTFTIDSTTRITALAPPGAGTVQVTVVTPSGTSNGVPYAYAGAPALNGVSPNQGPTSGGNTVTLSGINLIGVTAVRFGGAFATSFAVVSATQIVATAPAGTGTVQVTVVTSSGTSNGISYTYALVPALMSITPNSGPVVGGSTVTLSGVDLAGATAVRFGGAFATSFAVVSATQIVATTPAGTGTVQVTVVTPSGTSNGIPYTYAGAPALNGVSPNQGPTSGGNTVTLSGAGLVGATAVRFGAVVAVSFVVVSATEITAVVPAGGAGATDITVTTPGGTSTLPSSYFYLGIPSLTGVTPDAGPLGGGNTVTVTGTGLVGATAVRFGAVVAVSFVVVSATEITAVVPAGGAGATDITVTTPGGTSNAVFYTYSAAPALTGLSPDRGPTAGGNAVTLAGADLAGTTTVSFDTTPASFTVVSDDRIVAEVPAGIAGPAAVTVTTPGGTSNAAIYTRVPPPGI